MVWRSNIAPMFKKIRTLRAMIRIKKNANGLHSLRDKKIKT